MKKLLTVCITVFLVVIININLAEARNCVTAISLEEEGSIGNEQMRLDCCAEIKKLWSKDRQKAKETLTKAGLTPVKCNLYEGSTKKINRLQTSGKYLLKEEFIKFLKEEFDPLGNTVLLHHPPEEEGRLIMSPAELERVNSEKFWKYFKWIIIILVISIFIITALIIAGVIINWKIKGPYLQSQEAKEKSKKVEKQLVALVKKLKDQHDINIE